MTPRGLKNLASGLLAATLVGCATVKETADTSFRPQDLNDKLAAGYVQNVETFMVILDSSGSMADKYQGQRKFDLAKTIVSRMNRTIPGLQLTAGSRTFGSKAWPLSPKTTVVYGPGQYSESGLELALENLEKPRGVSPLARAIDATGEDLRSTGGKIALIIVSDGKDMDQAPVRAAEKVKSQFGERLCIHTVTVGDDTAGTKLMQEIAQASGCGRAVNADSIAANTTMASFVEQVFLAKAPQTAKAPEPKVMQTAKVGDADGDGVADDVDQCPNTQTKLVDTRGCPWDKDGDKIADYQDQCPDTPRGAPVNAVGCWVLDMVHFDFDKAELKPQYQPVLREAAKILKENPSLRVEIQGYTDNIGDSRYNSDLSLRRAKTIQDYLVNIGVPQERLTAKGYGENKPIAQNQSADGRAQNRRTQLNPIP